MSTSGSKPREGQIVRITKFGAWMSRELGELWAEVTDVVANASPPNEIAVIRIIAGRPRVVVDNIDEDWDNWSLDDGDVWTSVPPSKVPNWVWVQQAKRELIGATEDDE